MYAVEYHSVTATLLTSAGDIFGRRWAFNLTIGITSVFGLIAAGSPNFAAIGCFAALWSVGVGGNLPVDSAIFLEFLPGSHQYLLTVLSVFWAFAQLLATLVAWPLLGYHTCQETATTCTRSENFGWRWFMIAMGLLAMFMFCCRFFLFTLYESPKYLMGRGKDEEAVRVVHEVARINGKTTNLTLADLEVFNQAGQQGVDASAALKRKLEKVNFTHLRALFASPKLAWSTSLIILIWAFIGLGFPLYNAFLPCKSPLFSNNCLSLSSQLDLSLKTCCWSYKSSLLPENHFRHVLQLELHLEIETLTPKSCRHSGNAWCKIRRWFHIYHLPQLHHHRCPWSARGSTRRCASRSPSIRSKRCLGIVNSADRRIPILLHHCRHFQRIVGLELCLQLHE